MYTNWSEPETLEYSFIEVRARIESYRNVSVSETKWRVVHVLYALFPRNARFVVRDPVIKTSIRMVQFYSTQRKHWLIESAINSAGWRAIFVSMIYERISIFKITQ